MKTVKNSLFVSLLDLISCALGAAILLAVIFSIIEEPVPLPKAPDYIVTEFKVTGNVKLGIAIYSEESNEFILVAGDEGIKEDAQKQIVASELANALYVESMFGTEINEQNQNVDFSKIVLSINAPISGRWHFIPYIYDYLRFGGEPNVTKIDVFAQSKHQHFTCEPYDDNKLSEWKESGKMIPSYENNGDGNCNKKGFLIIDI